MIDHLRPPPSDLIRGAALFLDFDGTLVELADAPDAIRIPHGLGGLIERLAERLGGRVAIVSGRALSDLDRHLAGPGVAVSGSHGLELRLPSGASTAAAAPEGLGLAADEIRRFAAADPGLLVEEKPASIALHYRLAPGREEEAVRFVSALAERTGLSLQPGKMVVELRPGGADKGDALRRIMAEPPFPGARPLFVGDDLTDEHAFEAAADLGGGGILVGPPRPTAARWRLDGVSAVEAWLRRAAEAAHG